MQEGVLVLSTVDPVTLASREEEHVGGKFRHVVVVVVTTLETAVQLVVQARDGVDVHERRALVGLAFVEFAQRCLFEGATGHKESQGQNSCTIE